MWQNYLFSTKKTNLKTLSLISSEWLVFNKWTESLSLEGSCKAVRNERYWELSSLTLLSKSDGTRAQPEC